MSLLALKFLTGHSKGSLLRLQLCPHQHFCELATAKHLQINKLQVSMKYLRFQVTWYESHLVL